MRLRVGDRIEDTTTGRVVEILQIRPSGYTWRTVSRSRDVTGYAYCTDDTDDPFFEQGWQLQSRSPDNLS
jgi:hypothetical protein